MVEIPPHQLPMSYPSEAVSPGMTLSENPKHLLSHDSQKQSGKTSTEAPGVSLVLPERK
jgi:hypothetical protein